METPTRLSELRTKIIQIRDFRTAVDALVEMPGLTNELLEKYEVLADAVTEEMSSLLLAERREELATRAK